MLDITNKSDLVGVYYSIWHNLGVWGDRPIYNNTEIMAGDKDFGRPGKYHYWAEPAIGYYNGETEAVYRNHLELLQEANVDFIILDDTNGSSTFPKAERNEILIKPSYVLLETALKMRQEGKKTPHIMYWVGAGSRDPEPFFCGMEVYDLFYKDKKYEDLFVYFDGKPFLLTTDMQPAPLEPYFTMRKCWGLQGTLAEKEWSFLQKFPQNVAYNNGKPEEICVCTALQQTYMTEPTAIGRHGGQTFKEEWERAFEIRPKVVTVTWWNEWIAIYFQHEGRVTFVDNYIRPLSRDIEPMRGGHGDLYYKWLKEYISAYKNGEECPKDLLEENYMK